MKGLSKNTQTRTQKPHTYNTKTHTQQSGYSQKEVGWGVGRSGQRRGKWGWK